MLRRTRPLPFAVDLICSYRGSRFAAPGGFNSPLASRRCAHQSERSSRRSRHEIAHVAEHTVTPLKSKAPDGTQEAASNRGMYLGALVNRAYDMVLENSFDRGDELDADKEGILLVQKAGYAGTGLSEFLSLLAERNKGQAEKNGLFASHPETQERIGKVKQLAASKPGAACRALHLVHHVHPTPRPLSDRLRSSARLTGGESRQPS